MEDPKDANAAPEAAKPVTGNPDDGKPAQEPAATPAQEPERDKAADVLASISADQATDENNAVENQTSDQSSEGNDDLEFQQPDPEQQQPNDRKEDDPAPEPEKRKTVTVACGVIGGITIRRFAAGHDDGTGKRPVAGVGNAVTLPGPSAVEAGINNMRALDPVRSTQDEEFMLAWMKENARNPMVVSGQIAVIEDNSKRA